MSGYAGLPPYYLLTSDPFTLNLGLSLKGCDPIVAENFVLIDTAVGSGASKVYINGSVITSPNFNNSTPAAPAGYINVLWQTDGNGNVSAYVSTSGGGGGVWGDITGTLSNQTDLQAALTALSTSITTETTRAESAESSLSSAISAETTRAEAAEALLAPISSLAGYVPTSTTVNGHALSSNVTISASDLTTGTLPHAQLPTLLSGDIPNNAANTTGTAANLSGTPALPNGTTATTQATSDNSTNLATTAYVQSQGYLTTAVTSFSAGNLSPLFTTNVSNSTSTPSLSFSMSNAAQNSVLAGPSSGGAGAPSYRSLLTADLPTSGTWAFAGTVSGGLTFSGNPSFTGTLTLGLSSYTTAITSSPSLVVAGSYESASTPTYAEDSWTIQDVIGTGVNGTSTLTLTHSGSTGQASFALTSTTAATSSTTNGSPYNAFQANYWTGSASALDQWAIYQTLGSGTNGQSLLNIAHVSGSTGAGASSTNLGVAVNIPGGNVQFGASSTVSFNSTADGTNYEFLSQNTGLKINVNPSSTGLVTMESFNSGAGFLFETNWTSAAGADLFAIGNVSSVTSTSGTFCLLDLGGNATKGFTLAPTATATTSLIGLEIAPTVDIGATVSWTGSATMILVNPTLTATGSGTPIINLMNLQVGGVSQYAIDQYGHHTGNGNYRGQATAAASGTPTTVTVTYTNSFASTPYVVVTPLTSGVGNFYISASSTSGFTITWANGTNSAVWNWIAIA